MRFSDVTLDGLMKEFEQISKASENSEQTYTLPQDLLDQPAAVADVPYYDEILKSTAAERTQLYNAVADSKILDEAHPHGSTKLEGLNGEETTVEDLQDMKKKFEEVVQSKVKSKSATLITKLQKLSNNLTIGGHDKLAEQVNGQIKKLAVEFGDEDAVVTDVPKVNVDDKDALVTNIPKGEHNKVAPTDNRGLANISNIIAKFDNKLMSILGEKYYTGTPLSWSGLDKSLRKYFNLFPSNAQNLPAGAKTYSNWDQLGKLVDAGLADWQYLNDNLKMGDEALDKKLDQNASVNPEALNPDNLRRLLAPGAGPHEAGKGAPVAPQLPLSVHAPGRDVPK